MAGLYIHIPFCRKACTYCDFHFSTNLSRMDEMAGAIGRELRLQKGFFPEGTTLDSVYFGGGTPSVMSENGLAHILDRVAENWPIKPNAEITLEANPDDLDKAKIKGLLSLGINRLSIGIQSFDDLQLNLLNRSHSALQALNSVRYAQDEGLENITIDLIYGLPGMGMDGWEKNIRQALSLKVPHISAYALTVEKKTTLSHQVNHGKVAIPSDETFAAQYLQLIDMLGKAGINQYELSNFAKPGMEAKHNGSYWNGEPYLGIGPSAHSFTGDTRFWNVSNNAQYLSALAENRTPTAGTEILTSLDRLNEYLMTGLRTVKGIDWNHILDVWNVDLRNLAADEVEKCLQSGWAKEDGARFHLTTRGFLVSDSIISSLFLLEMP